MHFFRYCAFPDPDQHSDFGSKNERGRIPSLSLLVRFGNNHTAGQSQQLAGEGMLGLVQLDTCWSS